MRNPSDSDKTARMGGPAELSSDHITKSTRDPVDLGRLLEAWLGGVLPEGAEPTLTDVVTPEGSGMSSETLLFTARWIGDHGPIERRCVARIEPELDKNPLFPSYDLEMQYRVMTLVGEATAAPVPTMFWLETDATVIGAPFLVMGRIDGLVPPDVMPYTFGDCWVASGSAEDLARLQASAVLALVAIHTVTPETDDLSFLDYGQAGDTALERHLALWELYLRWVTAEEPSPLLNECFAWLRANLPSTVEAKLSWGDARIGNMLFDNFEAAGVLDWEMAGIAPPEVDLGWMAYMHLFFQDIATDLGVAGMPDFLTVTDVAASYDAATGRTTGDLTWYMAYAAMRHGVIMRRVTERAVLFGEAIRPPDVDDMIIHRNTLRRMLDGTYW